MTAPNRATLWGQVIVDELAAAGVETVCVAPGSRSTPLTAAAADHPALNVHSHLDERAASFYALGYARCSGEPTAVISTSGTAAANFHPAVIEAAHSRVPLVVLTADRPGELQDSGANQTIDQTDLYGDVVRFSRTTPEPAPEPRRLRSLRTTVCRAVGAARGTPLGPVHLNTPFAKPLAPTPVADDVPESLADDAPTAVTGRDGPFVSVSSGRPSPSAEAVEQLITAIQQADRGLIVAGPATDQERMRSAVDGLLDATGFPVVADPLSGVRFGPVPEPATCIGGYDSFLGASSIPAPDCVIRLGASPTSKRLRQYLRDADARQFVVDPAGEWREAEFTATDLVVADPVALADALPSTADSGASAWHDTIGTADDRHWELVAGDAAVPVEGKIAATVLDAVPSRGTLYLSNSMPVRDVDRFGQPSEADITVLGNRGASGIDGITSSALGAAAAADGPLVALVGDLAYYHDLTGLLAAGRCPVEATIVVVNNDGGGIFHKLPIADFDPPFTELFRTPHGLSFEGTETLFDIEYEQIQDSSTVAQAVSDSVARSGTQVLEVTVDGDASHRTREAFDTELSRQIAQELDTRPDGSC
jgi:2-succinyl-5-enolpyruvyl-6-hydroxy-3-cyclohexene-1-carboxylate synthase